MVNKLWTVCIFILVVEVAERLCYYSISGSQRNFLEDPPTKMNAGAAGAINSVFTMLSYLSCFLGGYLADQWLGRYKTILIFASVYFAGTVMVAATSTPHAVNLPIYLIGCLFFISLGTGAIKPNVMNFGASQYDESDPIEKQQQKTFFSYFYLMINVGAGVSFGFLINITTSKASSDSLGWGFNEVYCIAAAAMGCAVLAFVAGTCKYKKEPPVVHKPMISVIRKYLCRSAGKSARGAMAACGWCLIPVYIILNLIGSIQNNALMTNICMVLCIISTIFLVLGHMKNDWITEFSEEIQGSGLTLADVKKTVRLVPQMLLVNMGFNIPYNAMNNAYPALACQMDLRIGSGSHQLNGAFTNLGDCVAIIVGVPIIESCLFPALERRRGKAVPRRIKYIWGFAFAIAANAVAIVIEDIRRTKGFVPGKDGVSKCAPTSLEIHMSEMSCLWAFVPMLMTGVGEILVNPVVYEFAFAEAPSQLMSVVQAFNLIVAGSLSNCITGPLSLLVFPDNLNNFDVDNILSGNSPDGRGDVNITFILNIVFGVLCLVAYLVVERFDECDPEDLSLKKEEGEQPLADAEQTLS